MLTSDGHQRWKDCHILQSRSSSEFLKLSPTPAKVKKIFKKCKIQVQMKSKNLAKYNFLMTTITQFLFINSVQMRSWSKICEAFYNPDPIQNQHNSS